MTDAPDNGPAACVAETTAPSISPSQEGVGSAGSGAAPIDRAAVKAAIEIWSPWVAITNSPHLQTLITAANAYLNGAKGVPSAEPVADAIVRDVAELPDRNSPDDWPEAMLVTGDELRMIVERHTHPAAPAQPEGEKR